MNSLQHYINFNESASVQVTKVGTNPVHTAAICHYTKASHSSFFLKDATLTYVISGEKYMLLGKQEYLLKAGDLLFIPKSSVVFTHIPKQEKTFESCNIILSEAFMQDAFISHQAELLILSKEPFAIQQSKRINICFTDFFKSVENHTDCLAPFLFKICKLMKKQLFVPAEKNNIKATEFQTIYNTIVDHIYKPQSLELLAEKCNMSLATFKRKFKSAFGHSPHAWIRNIRLQAAYFHLKTEVEMVSEISSFVGFDNLSHFTYTFRQYFKKTPTSILSEN